MSSGHGAFGGRGRCFQFWEDFSACINKNNGNINSADCVAVKADYFECLHHTKAVCSLVRLPF
jgi:hypothetical protein